MAADERQPLRPDHLPIADLFRGPQQTGPAFGSIFSTADKEYLHLSAGIPGAEKSCRHHPRIVHHQQVTGQEMGSYVPEGILANLFRAPFQQQQP